jgi:hypothetical protein
MDNKKIAELISKLSQYLDDFVLEGISLTKYKDESMEGDGIKIDSNLIVHEVDGDLILERITEIPATRFDPGDTIYEELAVGSSIEELFPHVKEALEMEQEERDALAWLDYENEIEDSFEEDSDEEDE